MVVTVLKGSLQICLGEERTILFVGDAMSYDPRIPHTWGNPSKRQKAVVLFFDVPATF